MVRLIASEWLRRKVVQGQGFKAWLMCRWSWLLILAFTHTKKRLGKAKH